MAGHGSPRPPDQAGHPNRKVDRASFPSLESLDWVTRQAQADALAGPADTDYGDDYEPDADDEMEYRAHHTAWGRD